MSPPPPPLEGAGRWFSSLSPLLSHRAGVHLLAVGRYLGALALLAEQDAPPLVLLCLVPNRDRPQKLRLVTHTRDVRSPKPPCILLVN